MKPRYDVLGKSHYALAIIGDILALMHPEGCSVQVVTNIPEAMNDSRPHAFEVPGIDWDVIPSEDYRPAPRTPKLLGTIGKSRAVIVDYFKHHHNITRDQYLTLRHPAAVVPETVAIGHGVHIGPASTIAPFSQIGDFCVINRNVSIGHHTTMDDFVCLNPGVTLAGVCHLGAHVTVGAGATIIDQIRIGARTIVGAGSVVTKHLPAEVVAYGVPAKVVRRIND